MPRRIGIRDENEPDTLGLDDPREVPVRADHARRGVDLRAISSEHADEGETQVRPRPRRQRQFARQRAAPHDEGAPKETGALRHPVVGRAPRRDDEGRQSDRDEKDAPPNLERRDDIEREEQNERSQDDPAQRAVVDDPGVPGRREVVQPRIVEGGFDHEREEQRLLGDVRHREAGVHAEA